MGAEALSLLFPGHLLHDGGGGEWAVKDVSAAAWAESPCPLGQEKKRKCMPENVEFQAIKVVTKTTFLKVPKRTTTKNRVMVS